jgi:adenylate kinase
VALNVIMMGPPGAGKGTQAGRFARERGLLKISTGDILRESIKAGSPVGTRAKTLMDRGELIDDATMIDIVRERLLRSDAQPGFVLDGFPRTVAQAEALDRIVAERGSGPLVVVDVRVPETELVRRLASRLICATCGANAEQTMAGAAAPTACAKCGGELEQRADDNEQIVLERLKVYERATKPLVEFYRDRPTFRIVNGAQPQERVAHEMDTVIDDAVLVGAKQEAPAAVKAASPEKAARA